MSEFINEELITAKTLLENAYVLLENLSTNKKKQLRLDKVRTGLEKLAGDISDVLFDK